VAEQTTENKTLWWHIFRNLLPMDQRTLVGTVVAFAMVVTLAWVGLNELDRMGVYTDQYRARAIQRGAATFVDNCAECHGADGKGLPGIGPALNDPEMFDGTRLTQMGWSGSLEQYLIATVAGGRPAKSDPAWPNVMPTWSQDYGGPMRPDEVRDVVYFVMNWGCQYDPECAAGPIPTREPTPTPGPTATPVDISTLVEIVNGLQGDPVRGQQLYDSTLPSSVDGLPLACFACHTLDGSPLVGPSFQGVMSRIPADYPSADYYLLESILYPETYKSPGFESAVMTANFGSRLTEQDLADMLAFLKTQ